MGYHTDFHGEIIIEPPLSASEVLKLNAFASERHEEREGYPSTYCEWVPTSDGKAIVQADGDGSNYNSGAWMKYIIDNFLQGHTANGKFEASGDEHGDYWLLIVENGEVFTHSLGLEVTGERKAVETPAAPPPPPSAPTLMTNAEFILTSGNLCPACKSAQLEFSEIKPEGITAIQGVVCLDCDAAWDESFTLDRYTMTRDPAAKEG